MTDGISEAARWKRETQDWHRCAICFGRFYTMPEVREHIFKDHSVNSIVEFVVAVSLQGLTKGCMKNEQ